MWQAPLSIEVEVAPSRGAQACLQSAALQPESPQGSRACWSVWDGVDGMCRLCAVKTSGSARGDVGPFGIVPAGESTAGRSVKWRPGIAVWTGRLLPYHGGKGRGNATATPRARMRMTVAAMTAVTCIDYIDMFNVSSQYFMGIIFLSPSANPQPSPQGRGTTRWCSPFPPLSLYEFSRVPIKG